MLRTGRLLLMSRPLLRSVATASAAILLAAPLCAAEALRVVGSTTVNPVVGEAAEILRRDEDMRIVVDTLGGSSGGIAALAEGRADLAMSSRPIDDGDRRRYPEVDFRSHVVGHDAVALVVSGDVWEAGVRSLSRRQVRGLYERRIRNWKELGGPDRRVVFFDKEPGRGTWEVFADWLYGDADRAPTVAHRTVGSNEEVRAKVSRTAGAVAQLSAAWADGEGVHALALEVDGASVTPNEAAIADRRYPIVRPLLLVSDGPPGDLARRLVEFLTRPRGQRLVTRHGYLPIAPSAADADAEPRHRGGP